MARSDIAGMADVLPKDLFRQMRVEGTLTGSKAFGGFVRGESDVDVFLMPFKFKGKEINGYVLINEYGAAYEPHEYVDEDFVSVYVRSPMKSNLLYNFLFMHNQRTYDLWRRATYIMREACELIDSLRKLVQNKGNRVDLFETIKGMVENADKSSDQELSGEQKKDTPF